MATADTITNAPQKRIAIVGAGVSGIASVKSCLESGLQPVCFEQSGDIGGLWRYKPGKTLQGEGTVMKSTTINTSKEMMAFSDFPPPAHFHNFMHHSQLMEYFRLYVDHFNLLPHFRFNHRVTRIRQNNDYDETGRWEVSYKDLENNDSQIHTEVFDGVMLCSGHHTYPYIPSIPGQDTFKGLIQHSHDYRNTQGYEDKTVVVVGMGNSAGDIAVGLGYHVAKKVYMSVRRRVWVFNRNAILGMPYDFLYFNRFFFWLLNHAAWVVNLGTKAELNRRIDHVLYGINPGQGPYQSHPFVNDDFPRSLTSGAVTLKPGIERLSGTDVHFTDGSVAPGVDIVMLCTGYTLAFPFLEKGVISVHENEVPLFKHMYPAHLKHPTLAVIGLIQPFGTIQAIAELQARVFAKVILKPSLLPSRDAMEADISKATENRRKRYVNSRRHTFQVDGIRFMDELADIIGVTPPGLLENIKAGNLSSLGKLYIRGTLPYQYRLAGPDKWDGAMQAINTAARRHLRPYTDVTSPAYTEHIRKNYSVLKNTLLCIRICCFHAATYAYPLVYVALGLLIGLVLFGWQ